MTVGTGDLGVANACGCFTAGTPVIMKDGTTKPIEAVVQGDQVLSKDEQTGRMEARRVVQISRRTVGRVVSVTLTDPVTHQSQTLTATADHPFYVQGKGFVPAGQLGVGTSIVTRAGPALTVSAAHLMPEQVGGYTVYNLTVEGDHTYFVGSVDGGAWVHNLDCWGFARNFRKAEGGEVWKLSNGGYCIERAHDPFSGLKDDFTGAYEPWVEHAVHVKDGMVRDPMMLGHTDAVPLAEWKTHYNNFDLHDFVRSR